MVMLGDPYTYQILLFSQMAYIYDLLKRQAVAVGQACHSNTAQMESEILKHLKDLGAVKKYDKVQMPMSVPDDNKPNLFPGGQMPQPDAFAFLDDSDSDSTSTGDEDGEANYYARSSLSDDEDMEDTMVKNTDTEMQRCTQSMLISSDREKDRLVVLSQCQDRVADKAAC